MGARRREGSALAGEEIGPPKTGHPRGVSQKAAALAVAMVRPRRRDEPGRSPHLAPIRQRIESIFQTCKDQLTLERHGARTLHGLRTRIRQPFPALAAAISLNHRLGRPTRTLIATPPEPVELLI